MTKRRKSKGDRELTQEEMDEISREYTATFGEQDAAIEASGLVRRLLGEDAPFPPPEEDGKIRLPSRPPSEAPDPKSADSDPSPT
jgi:hypothetical protein